MGCAVVVELKINNYYGGYHAAFAKMMHDARIHVKAMTEIGFNLRVWPGRLIVMFQLLFCVFTERDVWLRRVERRLKRDVRILAH